MARIEFMTVSRSRTTSRYYPYAFYCLRNEDVGRLLLSSGHTQDIPFALSTAVQRTIRRWLRHRGTVRVHTSPTLLACLEDFSFIADRFEESNILQKIIHDIQRLSATKECIVISCVRAAGV